jgi:hypothetical protein
MNLSSEKCICDKNIIEQINTFNYPGCPISYQNEKAVTVKIWIFLKITGIINRTLKPSHVQKCAGLKI